MRPTSSASTCFSALSPNDEFANFEILSYLLGDPQGRFPHIPGSCLSD
jgi:hypothetical protein